jgi:hypothetical protein
MIFDIAQLRKSNMSCLKKTNSTLLKNKLNIVLLYLGMCCVVSTIYLTDISPRTMRGKIVTFHQLFIVIGVLVGQIVGVPWLLGQHE